MAQLDLRKLKDDAADAVDRGKFKKARDYYEQLAAADSADGNWPRRAAEMSRKLGHEAEAIASYLVAAHAFVKAGFLIQGVAMCKNALQLDPTHQLALAKLANLQQEAQGGAPSRPAVAIKAAAPGTPPAPPMAAIALAQAVPGVHVVAAGAEPGVVEISLDDEDIVQAIDAQPVASPLSPPPAPPPPPSPPPLPSARAASAPAAPAAPTAPDAAVALRAVPLFGALDADSLARLALGAQLMSAAPGTKLVTEGTAGDTMFVVVEGEVAVVSEAPMRVELARLGPSEFFGEIALMTDVARSATVIATAPTELLVISRQLMHDLVAADAAVWPVLLRFLRGRLLDRLLRTNPIFSQFEQAERNALVHKFRFLEAAPGTVLIAQGAQATGLFLLMAGTAEVRREGHAIATLGQGDLCGEMSLLANEVAGAEVAAASKCLLLHLPAAKFRQVIVTHPQVLMMLSELADKRALSTEAHAPAAAFGHLSLF